jgi:hypothetical protein
MSLKYHGHVFDASAHCSCCVADAGQVLIDPTNTGRLRSRFNALMAIKWRSMRVLTREIIIKHDLLSLKSAGLMQVAAPAITRAGTKMQMFERWFMLGLTKTVLGNDGSWMRPLLNAAYSAGTAFGQSQSGVANVNVLAQHREDALQALAVVELQGVINTVVQQSVRAVSHGLLVSKTPMEIVRSVWAVIDKVGINRSKAMVELMVIRAHAEASLDIYEANGVQRVGLVPEGRPVVTADAEMRDAKKKSKAKAKKAPAKKSKSKTKPKAKRKPARRSGAGSRSYSKEKAPSQRTIQRIRKAERELGARLGERVNVRTAGDNDVCPVCEDIADGGPYTIARARSLIPAHPRCRCTFVPADDARYASDDSLPDDDALSPQEQEFAARRAAATLHKARKPPQRKASKANPYYDPDTGQWSRAPGSMQTNAMETATPTENEPTT